MLLRMDATQDVERLLPRREVERIVGMRRSAIYARMRRGDFPEPVRLGPGSVRWKLSEVQRWIDSLPRSHGEGVA